MTQTLKLRTTYKLKSISNILHVNIGLLIFCPLFAFGQIQSFEESTVPATWTTGPGATLETSALHFKDGTRSLQWNRTDSAAVLTANNPAGLAAAGSVAGGGISGWIYNDAASDETLSFRFGSAAELAAGNPRYTFEFGLNFTGWRAVLVKFTEDAAVPGYSGSGTLEMMQIEAPAASQAGTLFFDRIEFKESIISSRQRDYQQPFVNEPSGSLWLSSYAWSQTPPTALPASAGQAERDAFAAILDRFDRWNLGTAIAPKPSIAESFTISGTSQTIDKAGNGNETVQTSQDTGYRWGGFNAGSSDNIQLKDTGSLRWRKGAATAGSYAYTIFDASGSQPPANATQQTVDFIQFSTLGSFSGIQMRFLVRSAADSAWYASDSLDLLSLNGHLDVHSVSWTPLSTANNGMLNALDSGDDTALTITGTPGSFADRVGGIIDGGGFLVTAGTGPYFNMDDITWGMLDPIGSRHQALQRYIQDGLNNYAALNIQRANGTITGTPLFTKENGGSPDIGRDVFQKIMIPLAMDCKLNGSDASKQKFFDLLDHCHDQGWHEGSAMGSMNFEPLRTSGYMNAVVLMRDELRATGRLERERNAIRWYSNLGKIYTDPERTGASADELRSIYLNRLIAVLLMNDATEEQLKAKVRDMSRLLLWQNNGLSIAHGWMGTIKPDYTGFHHYIPYSGAYAPQAFHLSALVNYFLHDTPFALSDNSQKNLRNVLLTLRNMCNQYDVPMGVCGRFPFNNQILLEIMPSFAYMALSGNPETGAAVDVEMAGVLKRLWEPASSPVNEHIADVEPTIMYMNTLGAVELMEQTAALSTPAEAPPSGHWAHNYSLLSVHRRDNWMVSVKGMSQYSASTEHYYHENEFGRYLGHGGIQIFNQGNPVTREASGVVEDGWDWNRIPGTTAITLPASLLVKKSWDENVLMKKRFTGGLSLENRDGAFVMELDDYPWRDRNVQGRTTLFFFDDLIVALGRGIANTDASYPTATTLFQTHLATPATPTVIDGTAATAFPLEQAADTSAPHWLIDAASNGYYVPENQPLHISRTTQLSRNNRNTEDTTGDFATAWIDHGTSPGYNGNAAGEYHYAILVDTTAAAMQTFAAAPTYRVLERAAAAHIVEYTGDPAATTTAYALFNAGAVAHGPLAAADKPCLAMTRETGDALTISVCDPDLRLTASSPHHVWSIPSGDLANESPVSKVQVTLRGSWNAQAVPDNARVISTSSEATVLEFDCTEGKSIEMTLSSGETYSAWKAQYEGGAGQPASIGGPEADYDGDGLSNHFEYGLGQSPLTASGELRPTIRAATTNANSMDYTFTFNNGVSKNEGLRLTVKSAPELTSEWAELLVVSPPYVNARQSLFEKPGVISVIDRGGNCVETTLRHTVPAGTEKQFIKLEIESAQ
ncbi:chondroitinase family polysaccharide lyase [Tichowtungia aerotolerans]|uniref:Uncharacterized protein n=1 Tax=Tichowtungia aerotolerans TaxID=2697043 RepID=A0A6P1M3Y7_9BACT|nr:chondroitinase family polysaccharide lyase [Tichowtungia aerotolerans]QHI69320.1 hypothetical protein GT409_07600 [Tichowtungia aerotolerans]